MSDIRDPETDQPLPVRNDGEHVQDMVISDMRERLQHGIRKYGTALQAHNGRNMLQDAYEEVLDLAVYLRGEIEERKAPLAASSGAAPDDTRIGSWVRSARLRRGFDQSQVGKYMQDLGFDWTNNTVSRTEMAQRPLRFTEALALLDVLGLEVAALSDPTDRMEP